jgi:hypothetical protein
MRDRQLAANQLEYEFFSPDVVAGLDIAVETLNPVLLRTENNQDSTNYQLDKRCEGKAEVQEVADGDFVLEPAATRSHILEAFRSDTSNAEATSDGCRLRCQMDCGTHMDTTEPSSSVEGLHQPCEKPWGDYSFQLDEDPTLAGQNLCDIGSQPSPFYDDMRDTLFWNPCM